MPIIRLGAVLRLLKPVLGLGFIGIEIAIGIEIGLWLFSYQSAVSTDFDGDNDVDWLPQQGPQRRVQRGMMT